MKRFIIFLVCLLVVGVIYFEYSNKDRIIQMISLLQQTGVVTTTGNEYFTKFIFNNTVYDVNNIASGAIAIPINFDVHYISGHENDDIATTSAYSFRYTTQHDELVSGRGQNFPIYPIPQNGIWVPKIEVYMHDDGSQTKKDFFVKINTQGEYISPKIYLADVIKDPGCYIASSAIGSFGKGEELYIDQSRELVYSIHGANNKFVNYGEEANDVTGTLCIFNLQNNQLQKISLDKLLSGGLLEKQVFFGGMSGSQLLWAVFDGTYSDNHGEQQPLYDKLFSFDAEATTLTFLGKLPDFTTALSGIQLGYIPLTPSYYFIEGLPASIYSVTTNAIINLPEGLMAQVSQEITNQQTSQSTEQYTVKTEQGANIPGENINVYDKAGNKVFSLIANNELGLQHFDKIVGKNLIVDYGTSFERTLAVYDVTTQSKTFESSYHSDGGKLLINSNIITFDYTLDQANTPQNAPTCSNKYNGYTETRIFDLDTKKLTKTGEIKCAFFE